MAYKGVAAGLFCAVALFATALLPHIVSAATIYVNSSTGDDSTGAGTSGSPYKTFHKAYTSASANDTINLTGTFTWTDSGESGDASVSGYSLAKSLTIVGQGADETIIQSASASTTGDRRVFTVNSGVTVTITDIELRHGRLTGSASTDRGGALRNLGTTTLDRVYIDNNSTGAEGGGLSNMGAVLTVRNSTVYLNTAGNQGGGIHQSLDSGSSTLHVINSTIVYNRMNASTATVGGGGIGIRGCGGSITNSTIAYNNMPNGGTSAGSGVWFEPHTSIPTSCDYGRVLDVKNSIISGNLRQGVSISGVSGQVDLHEGAGTVNDNGGNVFGKMDSATISFAATTWVDQTSSSGTLDGTFVKQDGLGTNTGSLSLSSTLAANATVQGTPTLAITSASSVSVNNGASGNNGSTAIPSTDQRGATRSSTTDVGAYEYDGGGLDSEAPSISLTAPEDGATVSGASVTLSATATDNTAVDDVRFYINGVLVGTDSSSPYSVTWDSTATTSGARTFTAIARDAAGNATTATARSITVNNTVTSGTPSITPSSSGATIAWSTEQAGSTRVFFGLVSASSSSTPETNTGGSNTTSHSVSLGNLPDCAVYKYQTVNKVGVETSTSTERTFSTSCTGGASVVTSSSQSITNAAGGTLSQGDLDLVVPTSFTGAGSALTFQAVELEAATFDTGAGAPTGKTRGSSVFHLTAFLDEDTEVDTFTAPLEVTLSYDEGDIDESTATIYRYDGAAWSALESCTVAAASNEITCETDEFSDFAVFGEENQTSSSSGGGGTSVVERVQNLLAIGNIALATTLMQQYPKAFAASAVDAVAVATPSTAPTPATAPQVSSVRDLRRGMFGEDVRLLQKFLNSNGFMVAEAGPGSLGLETTFFGARTEDALARYQKTHGIAPTSGYFGPITRTHITSKQLPGVWW